VGLYHTNGVPGSTLSQTQKLKSTRSAHVDTATILVKYLNVLIKKFIVYGLQARKQAYTHMCTMGLAQAWPQHCTSCYNANILQLRETTSSR